MKLSQTMQRIVELLDKDGVEKRQYRRKLEDITGVSYSGISQWFNGDTKNIEYRHLKAIGDYYKVSAEYLMGIEKNQEKALTAKQQEAIQKVRDFPEEHLHILVAFVDSLSQEDKKN